MPTSKWNFFPRGEINQFKISLQTCWPFSPLAKVLKADVEVALQVLNFAIYHKELTEMEEREQRELEMKQQTDRDADQNEYPDGCRRWFLLSSL